jgi:Mn-containing catalase
MLLNTGTEESAHIEMRAIAVALNLKGASSDFKDQIAFLPILARGSSQELPLLFLYL